MAAILEIELTHDTEIIGFIGAGNMANSLIRGLLARGVKPSTLLATDIDPSKLQQLHDECAIETATLADIASRSTVLVLAVKPQVMASVCRDLRPYLTEHSPLVISIAAGVPIAKMQDWLGNHLAIVRCMPNTPALIGRGATAMVAGGNLSDAQRAVAGNILNAVGISLWLDDEEAIDAVTALSGSGPAYFFLLMEAMQDTAMEMGLDSETARLLTCQTALGAAELAMSGDSTAADLRRQVTSPGGTTERALQLFEAGEFRKLVQQALLGAQKRSRELAQELG